MVTRVVVRGDGVRTGRRPGLRALLQPAQGAAEIGAVSDGSAIQHMGYLVEQDVSKDAVGEGLVPAVAHADEDATLGMRRATCEGRSSI